MSLALVETARGPRTGNHKLSLRDLHQLMKASRSGLEGCETMANGAGARYESEVE